jgi:hypothetical protein
LISLRTTTTALSTIEAAEALDSSKSFEQRAPVAGTLDEPRFADRTRFRGHRGGVISTHRALTKFVLEPLDLVMSVMLVLLFSIVWVASLEWVCRFWRYLLTTGTKLLALHVAIGLTEHHFTTYIHFVIPYPRMEDVAADGWTWWTTAAVVLLLFGASFLLPKRNIPLIYLLRAVLCVQASALIYFGWATASFPHTANSYMEGLVSYGLTLISFVPILFGLTYYIFDFGLIRKTLVTFLTMIHLCLFVPLQVLLQAIVLHKSILFMPVLYIVFGLPVDVLMVIAFYSWGMSWRSKAESRA